jgi:hypothetical protein
MHPSPDHPLMAFVGAADAELAAGGGTAILRVSALGPAADRFARFPLDGQHPLDLLLGFVAPPHWRALGVSCTAGHLDGAGRRRRARAHPERRPLVTVLRRRLRGLNGGTGPRCPAGQGTVMAGVPARWGYHTPPRRSLWTRPGSTGSSGGGPATPPARHVVALWPRCGGGPARQTAAPGLASLAVAGRWPRRGRGTPARRPRVVDLPGPPRPQVARWTTACGPAGCCPSPRPTICAAVHPCPPGWPGVAVVARRPGVVMRPGQPTRPARAAPGWEGGQS